MPPVYRSAADKPAPTSARPPNGGLSLREFVAFAAALMAMNALSIDIMLPALPQLAADLDAAQGNQRQAVITVFFVGLGAAQLVFGPLSDRHGRRPVLLGGLVVYGVAALACTLAGTFGHMLAARLAQGIGAASTRVIAMALVRDCYSGRDMGRVMSLVMMVFIAVPVLAPSLGQLILLVASWRWIFGALFLAGVGVMLWAGLRLPETLPPERRRPFSAASVVVGFRETLTTRQSVGYMVAMGIVLGSVFAFITSAQQVFMDVFGMGGEFVLMFAVITLCMSVAAFVNSRLVVRLGMRRLSHIALVAFIAVNAVHLLLVVSGRESLAVFVVFQALTVFTFGFMGANFNAMAMEPMGHIAGTASSLIGFFTTIAAGLLGFGIGQFFDGTTLPLIAGYLVLGVSALGVIVLVERGRLFGRGAA